MLNNIKQVIPNRKDREYQQIIRNSIDFMWRFLLRNLCDKSRCPHPRIIENESVIDSIVSGSGKGAIVITSHQGDWEDLIQYFRERDDLVACNLYRKPKCEKMVRFLRRYRGIEQYCSGYGIFKKYKNATDKKVFTLIGVDQKPLHKGITVNFLNRSTQISPICVQIALRLNIPIVIAKSLIKPQRAEISFRKINIHNLTKNPDDDVEQLALQRVMNEISHDIIEDPDQWLMWSHDFWKPAKSELVAPELVHATKGNLYPKKKTAS